jgi:hypothetical protein
MRSLRTTGSGALPPLLRAPLKSSSYINAELT